MSVPTQRQTHGRGARRRSHQAIKPKALKACAQCKKPVQPHVACGFCGTYKGRKVLAKSA